MPIFEMELEDVEMPPHVNIPDPDDNPFESDYSVWESNVGAAARESGIVNSIEDWVNPMPQATEQEAQAFRMLQYNPMDTIKGTVYDQPQLRPAYAGLQSDSQVQWQMAKHDLELTRLKKADAHPLLSLPGTFVGGMANYSTVAELGGLGKIAKLPLTVGRRTIAAAGYSAFMSGTDELVLDHYQDTRTPEEMIAATVFGAGFGGTYGALSGRMVRKTPGVDPNTQLAEHVMPDDFVGPPSPKVAYESSLEGGSGGAAKTYTDISQSQINEIMNNPDMTTTQKKRAIMDIQASDYEVTTPAAIMVGTAGGALKKIMPDVRMATDKEFGTMRRFAGQMLAHTVDFVGKMEGRRGVPLDTMLRQGDEMVDHLIGDYIQRGYTEYVTGSTGRMANLKSALNRDKTRMNRQEFESQMWRDITMGFKDPNVDPNVRKAAQELHNELLEPLGKKAAAYGHLEVGPDGKPLAPLGDELWFIRGWGRARAMELGDRAWVQQMTEGPDSPYMKQLHRRAAAEAEEVKQRVADVENEIADLKARQGDEVAELIKEAEGKLARGEPLSRGPGAKKDADAAKTGPRKPGHRAKLSNAQKTAIEVKQKRVLKDQIKKMRKEAKAMPFHKKLQEASTPAGRLKIEKEYMGHYDSITSSTDSSVYSDTGMGVTTDAQGNVVLSKPRSMDVATADVMDIDRRLLGENPMQQLSGAVKRMQRVLMVEEFNGDPTFKGFREDLDTEWQVKQQELRDKGLTDAQLQKAMDKLDVAHSKRKKDMMDTIAALYDIRKPPEHMWLYNLGSSLKSLAVLNQLGSVITSVLPEITAPLGSVGVKNYVRHIASAVLDTEAFVQMNKAQKADFLLGIQTAQFMRIGEMGENELATNMIAKGLRKGADVALDKVYGLGIWTRAATAATGAMVQSKLGRLMYKHAKGKLSARDLRELGEMGIRHDTLDIISQKVVTHGKRLRGGAVDMRIGEWGDTDPTAKLVRDAVAHEVNNTIIKPSTASVPFLGRTMGGSIIMQFKSFLLASTSKYMLQDMQRIFRGDMRGIERQMSFIGMGYLVTELKALVYEKDTSDKSGISWATDIMANGGGLGIAMEAVSGIASKFDEDSVRYGGNRTRTGMLLGAAGGQAVNLWGSADTIADMILGKDITSQQLKQMRRTIPGNNYAPTRWLVNDLEEGLYDML